VAQSTELGRLEARAWQVAVCRARFRSHACTSAAVSDGSVSSQPIDTRCRSIVWRQRFPRGHGTTGAYVRAGRGGFYYQQYLRAPSTPAPRQYRPAIRRPSAGIRTTPPLADQTVLGKPVEFVGELEQSADTFIAELNRRVSNFDGALWRS